MAFDAKKYHREWYQRNKERLQLKRKQRYLADPDFRNRRRRAVYKYRMSKPNYRTEENARMRAYNKTYRVRLKKTIIEAYGQRCVCCGETIFEFLTPDHINGGGSEHLRRRGTVGIYRDIIKEGFPKDKYRILCMNCNWARSVYGACPHECRGRP